jgi:hypothetical protein
LNARKQFRLFVRFAEGASAAINGFPAPSFAVLAPGDFLRCASSATGYTVALFNKPQVGPPPETALGKPCPVCRVPFLAASSCVQCGCGAVLHCEENGPDSLQCARLRPECPVCGRSIVLTEGYAEPQSHEE